MPNFGYETAGSTFQNQISGWVIGSKFTLIEDGTIISITGYINHDAGSDKFKMALYGNDSSLITETEELTAPDASGWVTGILSTPVLLSAGTYILAFFIAEAGNYMYYDAGSTGQTILDAGNTYPVFPGPGSFYSSFDAVFSIYATYNIIDSGLSVGSHQSVKVDMDW